jgi:hypothetical protein
MVGVVSALTTLIALTMYLFMYSGHPLTVESLFCVAPIFCLAAFFIFWKHKLAGAISQTILYVLAIWGAYNVILSDCHRGNCVTQNKVVLALGATIAGFQMIGMLAVLLLMWIEVQKPTPSQKSPTQVS